MISIPGLVDPTDRLSNIMTIGVSPRVLISTKKSKLNQTFNGKAFGIPVSLLSVAKSGKMMRNATKSIIKHK